MKPDPKLVEALASVALAECSCTLAQRRADEGCESCQPARHVERILRQFRVVQLPERASGRQAEYTGPTDDTPRWGKGWHYPFTETPTGRTRPYWTIYGEPEAPPTEEVNDGRS